MQGRGVIAVFWWGGSLSEELVLRGLQAADLITEQNWEIFWEGWGKERSNSERDRVDQWELIQGESDKSHCQDCCTKMSYQKDQEATEHHRKGSEEDRELMERTVSGLRKKLHTRQFLHGI